MNVSSETGELLATIISLAEYWEGKHFLTNGDDALQVGVLHFPKDSEVQAHTHKDKNVSHIKAMEVIMVTKGVMEASIYDTKGVKVISLFLFAGDVLIQMSGGHGFKFEKDTKILEVKCGPYQGKDGDKVMYDTSL